MTTELAIDFLRERQVAWFCKAIDVVSRCHATPTILAKQAKIVRDIARTVVVFHGKSMKRPDLNAYTQCVKSAGELVRDQHAARSHEALYEKLPLLIESMTQLAQSLRQS